MHIVPTGILPAKRGPDSDNTEIKRPKLEPYMAPPKGACPILTLPDELLTEIFSHYLNMNVSWKEAGCLAKTCTRIKSTLFCSRLLSQFFSQGGVGSRGMSGKLAVKLASIWCGTLPTLQLHFDQASRLNSEELSRLSSCSQLQALSLTELFTVTNAGLVDALKNNTCLQELSINYCPNISEAGFMKVLEKCKRIQKLRWDTSGSFTEKAITYVSVNCPDLRELHSEASIINETEMKILARGCTKLESLNIFQFGYQNTDEGLVELAINCTNLKRLELQYDGLFTDRVMTTLGNNCKKLEVLKFAELTLDRGMLITDAGLNALAQGCTNLRVLSLVQCKSRISHIGVGAIAQSCTKLAQLCLQSPYLDNKALVAVGRHCSSLTSLTMNNAHISDQGLAHFGRLMQGRIKTISLNQCDLITDIGIAALARYTPYLLSISLLGCSNLTVTAIEVLAQNHPNQDLLINLYFCQQFNGGNIAYLRSNYPRLKIQTQLY